MKKRKILAITGIRSEYFHLQPLLKSLNIHPDFQVRVVVTGAHLSPFHDYTIKMIEEDRFIIAERLISLFSSDELIGRVKGIGIQVLGLCHTVEREKPDIILILGDREEPLVGAIVGTYMNVAVAHLGGGDRVVGNIDDTVRHAITRLAHIHFAFSEDSAQRIIRMGEEPWRVFNTGCPGLDGIRETPYMSLEEISSALGFQLTSPFLVVIQHPLSSEWMLAEEQMEITLTALAEVRHQSVIIFPNTDAGSSRIIRMIQYYGEQYSYFRYYPNLPRVVFVNLLRNAAALVGNSSCGIVEAPFLKLPVINVGNRQKFRLHAENVLFVPFDKGHIRKAIEMVINDQELRNRLKSCSSPYGDGYACNRIIKVLAEIPLDTRLLNKDMTY